MEPIKLALCSETALPIVSKSCSQLLKSYIIIHKYHIVLANMLFCHQINYIFRINALLSRNFVVPIYALFLPIFLCSKVDHRQFVRFLDVCGRQDQNKYCDMRTPSSCSQRVAVVVEPTISFSFFPILNTVHLVKMLYVRAKNIVDLNS